jgi:hypothetical protein
VLQSVAVLLAIELAFGCRRDPVRGELAPGSSAHLSPGALRAVASGNVGGGPSPSIAADALSSRPVSELFDEARRTIAEWIPVLRAALAANDRERFARELFYPVRVNTASWCTFSLASYEEFLRYFDDIVTPRVRRAVAADPSLWTTGKGAMLGNGEVWFTHYNPIVTAFNSDTWEVKGASCEGWQLEAIPAWLNGTWRVSSVAEVQGTVDQKPPTQWNKGSVRIDIEHDTTEIALSARRSTRCKPFRFGFELEAPQARELDAASNGFESEIGKDYFLDLLCTGPKSKRIERLDVLGRSLLEILGNDGFLVFLKPEERSEVPLQRVADGEPCGNQRVECGRASVCLATPAQPGKPLERCQALSSLAWRH